MTSEDSYVSKNHAGTEVIITNMGHSFDNRDNF